MKKQYILKENKVVNKVKCEEKKDRDGIKRIN